MALSVTQGATCSRSWRRWGPRPDGYITVGSFNVLCEKHRLTHRLKNSQQQEHVDKRRLAVVAEVETIRADVMMLQEVDMSQLNLLNERLHEEFHYLYTPKLSGTDGNMILWRKDVFSCTRMKGVSLNSIRAPRSETSAADAELSDVGAPRRPTFPANQTAQFVQLRRHSDGCNLLIANTHLIFNKRRGDVKVEQLLNVAEMVRSFETENVILGGDLNLIPGSGLYHLLTDYNVDVRSLPPAKFLSAQQLAVRPYIQKWTRRTRKIPQADIIVGKTVGKTYPCFVLIETWSEVIGADPEWLGEGGLDLTPQDFRAKFLVYKSATLCENRRGLSKSCRGTELGWSSWADHQKGLVDYILTRGNIMSCAVLSVPGPNEQLPHASVFPPSDHIPLVVELSMW